jgi:anaerobic selenocysteine-containing dehydrogenase
MDLQQREVSRTTLCRACGAICPLRIDFEGDRPVAVHGVKDDPAYFGYSCIKGRNIVAYHQSEGRVLRSLRRDVDGRFRTIGMADACREIGASLQRIVGEHGPRAVAGYIGTFGYVNVPTRAFAQAFFRAIGSPMLFETANIDQPGKGAGEFLHGPWLAGAITHEDWDAAILVGNNPLVSINGGLGVNPARVLHRARKRGAKLVVIDPRRSETAEHADVFLQGKPGEDPAILAGIVRILLDEGRFDAEFVAAEANHLDELRHAVAPFTPEWVERRAGVSAADLVAAARLFGDAGRGVAHAGTGANMSGWPTLVEYLVRVLTTLRGGWLRAGEVQRNPGVFVNRPPAIAASVGPLPVRGFGEKLRVRGLEQCPSGLPTAGLVDEILTPGEGQVRALLVFGGNPMMAWPDQLEVHRALRSLDLIVCIDPRMSETARLAHYVLAPKLALETHGTSAMVEMFGHTAGPGWGFVEPYGAVARPVLDPPPDSEVWDDWEIVHEIARAMGRTLRVASYSHLEPNQALAQGSDIDRDRRPDPESMLAMLFAGSPVPFREILDATSAEGVVGRIFARPEVRALPKPEDWANKLDIGHPEVMAELARIASGFVFEMDRDPAYPMRLVSRRMHEMHNSSWHETKALQRTWVYNPAFMNPEDMAEIGIRSGDAVTITSARASIRAIAQEEEGVRCGCVSMAYGFGSNPGDPEDPAVDGACTARLVCNDRDFDPLSGIPRMSGIPVRVTPA